MIDRIRSRKRLGDWNKVAKPKAALSIGISWLIELYGEAARHFEVRY